VAAIEYVGVLANPTWVQFAPELVERETPPTGTSPPQNATSMSPAKMLPFEVIANDRG